MHSTIRTGLTVTVFLFLLAFSMLNAQTPRTISHQGRLDSLGTSVPDGARPMTFSIYDAPTDGVQLWTESKSVETVNGVYNTLLGSSTAISGFRFDRALWLGIAVAADPEMSPRTELTSVPSAHALVLPFVSEEDTSISVFSVTNAGTGAALYGSNTDTGTGVRGTSASGNGVYGSTNTGNAVFGRSLQSGGVGGMFWGYESGAIVSPDIMLQGRGLIAAGSTLVLDANNDSVLVDAQLEIIGSTIAKNIVQIQTGVIGIPAFSGYNQDLIIEANDAQVGLYSDGVGQIGSGLQFGEVFSGSVRDRWSMFRKTYTAGSSLIFTYGPNISYGNNPTKVEVDTAGQISAGSFRADSFLYSQPKSSYVSVNSSAFKATHPTSASWVATGTGAYVLPGGSTGWMVAPVNLPHGATVKGFECIMFDDTATDNLVCMLKSTSVISGNSLLNAVVASVRTTGTPGGWTSESTTAISPGFEVVDNFSKSHYLEVLPETGTWGASGADLMVLTVIIWYQTNDTQ